MSRRKRKINIYRIAEEAGVSAATVSRVINRRVGVGEKTRKRIGELLNQYNFTPDYPVVKTRKIAVVLPGYEISRRFRQALKGIFAYAEEKELAVNIVIANAPRKESLLESIRDQQCSGVIAILTQSSMKDLLELSESDLPLVVIDSQLDTPGSGFIDNDSYTGSAELTRHLIDLGHRKIGYLQYFAPSLNQLQRLKGFENTMRTAKLEVQKQWIIKAAPDPEHRGSWLIGKLTMHRLLDQSPEITAVMAVDDDMALGALTAIHERGLRIPEDISITGFDNAPETEASFPALTTVEHEVEKAGWEAARAIHKVLSNPMHPELPRAILPTRLVVRNSTGPAKQ